MSFEFLCLFFEFGDEVCFGSAVVEVWDVAGGVAVGAVVVAACVGVEG